MDWIYLYFVNKHLYTWWKNGGKSSKWVENTVRKGEIARYGAIPHFLTFSFSHSVFRTLVLQIRKNQGLFGKGLSPLFTEDGRDLCVHPMEHMLVI